MDSAGQKIELKGTEDGAKEVTDKLEKGLDSAKKSHDKVDKELDKRFKDIGQVEKDLGKRSDGMKQDMVKITSEGRSMISPDTKEAQGAVDKASQDAKKDSGFLSDQSGKEKKIREGGEKEMKKQQSEIKKLKIRKR